MLMQPTYELTTATSISVGKPKQVLFLKSSISEDVGPLCRHNMRPSAYLYTAFGTDERARSVMRPSMMAV